MSSYIFIMILVCVSINFIDMFEINMSPNCRDCKWFAPNKNAKEEYGLCKLFNNKITCGKTEVTIYNYAVHCRINPNLCGMFGNCFDEKDSQEKIDPDISELKILQKKIKQLESDLNGEVFEKLDIQNFEEELEDLQNKLNRYKLKKHNN